MKTKSTKSIAQLVNLNNSIFQSNRNFLAAFRLSKISKENEIFKCNKYIAKVLQISVRTLQRILDKLEKIGFLTRFKKFKNNRQIQNLIKLNITFFNNKKKEVSEKIEEKREFEQNLKNSMFSKNIRIKINNQKFEIVKIKNFLLLKIDKKIVKKDRSMNFYNFLFQNFQKHCNNILLNFENCEVEIDTENQKIYVQNLKGA